MYRCGPIVNSTTVAEDPSEIDWDELYLCLYAFTDKLLKKKRWFRRIEDGSTIKGKQVHDYVSDGIEQYLTCPEKHKPAKGSLSDYIKFNIIRTLVRNDVVSAENRSSFDLFAGSDDEEYADYGYVESLLPYTKALIDEQLDYDAVIAYIEKQAEDDNVVEEILLGLTMNLKRREIIEEFQMKASDYDNGKRRLDTILKNTISHFNLENAKS